MSRYNGSLADRLLGALFVAIAIVTLLVCFSRAFGRDTVPPQIAVVEHSLVRVWAGSGVRDGGTGVVLDSGCVLTAAHVVQLEPITVTPLGRSTVAATVCQKDTTNDEAVLTPATKLDCPGVRVAEDNPTIGQTVYTVGLGRDETLQWMRRTVVGYAAPSPGATPDWVILSGQARQGDSGMPLLDSSGSVMGVTWGTDATTCTAVITGRTQRLTQICGPGGCGQPRYMPMRPSAPPMTRRVVPVAPPVAVVRPQPATLDYEKLARIVLAKMAADQRFKGSAGPQGAVGAPGKPGEQGPAGNPGQDGAAGTDAQIDVDAITEAVVSRLPPLHLDILGAKGSVHQSQTARLGERFTIPPVVVSKTENGQVFFQAKPLGEPVRLELVPVK